MRGSRSWGKPRQFLQRGELPQRTGSPRPCCLTTRLAQLCAFNFLLLPYSVIDKNYCVVSGGVDVGVGVDVSVGVGAGLDVSVGVGVGVGVSTGAGFSAVMLS